MKLKAVLKTFAVFFIATAAIVAIFAGFFFIPQVMIILIIFGLVCLTGWVAYCLYESFLD